ncbi:MAG: hypothetical protein AUI14_03060 [Actinobacteria bacterium 13_2_20CM_2_71_6]|nr:MAG: hypothetical protein AUI14_03060 [Actinobacteria bacterium 13_2_20CM_2_71_6]
MRARRWRWLFVVGVAGTVAALGMATAGAAPTTTRVSSSLTGGPGNGHSEFPALSVDGRYVVFQSGADNLVPGDTNLQTDVFLRDRVTGAIERISVSTAGVQGVGPSGLFVPSAVTPDGRYVAFQSFARNLVPGDTNEQVDIFLRDRQAGTTTRVSVDSSGAQATGGSFGAAISSDGRYVMFTSVAPNLVPDDTNGTKDVFVHDMLTRTTTRVSVKASGAQVDEDTRAWGMSADGRFVAFQSLAKYTSGDGNNADDGFVKDVQTGKVERVSVTGANKEIADGSREMSISADGRFLAFTGFPKNLNTQVYVRDRATKKTILVSATPSGKPGKFGSGSPSISPDGRYVVFGSGSPDLVPGSPDFFNTYLRDLKTGKTTLESRTSTGAPIQESTLEGAMSNGGFAFVSLSTTVMPDGGDQRNAQVYFRSL